MLVVISILNSDAVEVEKYTKTRQSSIVIFALLIQVKSFLSSQHGKHTKNNYESTQQNKKRKRT